MLVNPTGRFVTGGPMGDTGLTGRKIIVDTYGGMAATAAARSRARIRRRSTARPRTRRATSAKNVVAAGLAERCELQVAYAIGVAHPVSIEIDCFGTERDLAAAGSRSSSGEHFDLGPAAIIRRPRPPPADLREDRALRPLRPRRPRFTWERTDKADALRGRRGQRARRAGV